LTRVLIQYRVPNLARSITELTITAGPLALLWFLMWATLDLGYWLSLLFAVPAAGFLVRLFMIQHDCGHGAFFHLRSTNDWVGRAIGVLTLTPYDFWRHTHAVHHSTSGNLDRRGIGDIDTLTVQEYLARSRLGSAALPRLPAPGHNVRPRARLFVYPTASAPGRPHA
jgi:acyl-lipid omega-6 desaturase (Delta-12 desaturase)